MSTKVIVANVESTILTYKDQNVCTTKQLAEFYAATEDNIQDNHRKNADRFVEGTHYFKLTGDALKEFRLQPTDSGSQVSLKT